MDVHQQLTKVGNKPTNVVIPVIQEEEDEPHPQPPTQDVWRSCCFQLSPAGVAFGGQLTVTIMVLGISTLMLVKADGDCNKSAPYFSMISFMLGKILSSVISSQK